MSEKSNFHVYTGPASYHVLEMVKLFYIKTNYNYIRGCRLLVCSENFKYIILTIEICWTKVLSNQMYMISGQMYAMSDQMYRMSCQSN